MARNGEREIRLASSQVAFEALERARVEKAAKKEAMKKAQPAAKPHNQQNDQVYSDQQIKRLAASKDAHVALMNAQKEKAKRKQKQKEKELQTPIKQNPATADEDFNADNEGSSVDGACLSAPAPALVLQIFSSISV
eukprot:gb/GEZN01025976.1/.p1 GENE.gb/GEZN01025976.1/~~gb/GEZN01025976.1/.p1  ORF type:complete len:137 (-),score=36.73 gb/GEZN01025976.1/:101-511(-)